MDRIKEWKIGEYGSININDRSIPTIEEVPYCRELNLNIEEIYLICRLYSLEYSTKGIINAFLLKWIYEKRIVLVNQENSFYLKFENTINLEDNTSESELYNFFLDATSNNMLNTSNFKEYITKNYNKIGEWFSKLYFSTTNLFINKGFLKKVYEKRIDTSSYRKKTIMYKTETELLRNKMIKILGLKKYLLDFSLLHEKEILEVNIWYKYLIFAEITNIASTVREHLNELYPFLVDILSTIQYIEENALNIPNISDHEIPTLSNESYEILKKNTNNFRLNINNNKFSSRSPRMPRGGTGGGRF